MLKTLFLLAFTIISRDLLAQTKIPVDSINNPIGENVTICSLVFGVKSTATVNLINLGAAYPNSPCPTTFFSTAKS